MITLTLAKETPPEKIERTLGRMRDPQRSRHRLGVRPRTHPRIVLEDFIANAPTIKAYYWFTPPEPWAYLAHAEKLNLRIARHLHAAEIKLA